MAKPKSSQSFQTIEMRTLAQDVMSSSLVVIRPDQTIREAVEILTEKKLTVLPVVDSNGKLLGLISEKDILSCCTSFDRAVPEQGNFLDKKISYQKPARTVKLTTPLDEVGELLARGKFRHVLVLDDDGQLKGIITRRDLIRVIYLRLELSKEGLHREIQT